MGGQRDKAGQEGQLVGTQADVPACPTGRRPRTTGMLPGRDNHRVSPGIGGRKVPPAPQHISRATRRSLRPWSPGTAQPPAHEGHQTISIALGYSIPWPVPGLGSLHRAPRAGRKSSENKSQHAQPGLLGKKRAADEDVRCWGVYHSSAPRWTLWRRKLFFFHKRFIKFCLKIATEGSLFG